MNSISCATLRISKYRLVSDGTGVTVTRLFLFGGGYEVEKVYDATTEETTTETTKYYALGGQRVMREDNGDLNFFLTDHLGSTVAVLDSSGNIESEQRYMPFGGTRYSQGVEDETDFGYTGQRNYNDFGLMDYGSREYSPRLGRFTQPDTIVPGMSSQSFNRYSYVNNNPVMMVDPSGHMLCNAKYDYCVEPNGESSGGGYSDIPSDFSMCAGLDSLDELEECLLDNGMGIPEETLIGGMLDANALLRSSFGDSEEDRIKRLVFLMLWHSEEGRKYAEDYLVYGLDFSWGEKSAAQDYDLVLWGMKFDNWVGESVNGYHKTIGMWSVLLEGDNGENHDGIANGSMYSLADAAGILGGEIYHIIDGNGYDNNSKSEELIQNQLSNKIASGLCSCVSVAGYAYLDPLSQRHLDYWINHWEIADDYYGDLPYFPSDN